MNKETLLGMMRLQLTISQNGLLLGYNEETHTHVYRDFYSSNKTYDNLKVFSPLAADHEVVNQMQTFLNNVNLEQVNLEIENIRKTMDDVSVIGFKIALENCLVHLEDIKENHKFLSKVYNEYIALEYNDHELRNRDTHVVGICNSLCQMDKLVARRDSSESKVSDHEEIRDKIRISMDKKDEFNLSQDYLLKLISDDIRYHSEEEFLKIRTMILETGEDGLLTTGAILDLITNHYKVR